MTKKTVWPPNWHPEAHAALAPYFGRGMRIEIVLGPTHAVDGTLLGGFVCLDEGAPTIIYDHCGRSGIYPWRILAGPMLRIHEFDAESGHTVVFAHPEWTPRGGE